MGEAKRRRQTDRIRPANISLSDFMMHMERHIGRVACGSCKACCYHPNVEIIANDDTSRLDTEIRDDGVRYLKRKPDGSCVHLGPSGCEVYERRPAACRTFDCRLYSALGIGIQFNADRGAVQQAPTWLFRTETAKDLLWRFAADIAVSGCEPGADADAILAYLSKNLETIMDAANDKLRETIPILKKLIADRPQNGV